MGLRGIIWSENFTFCILESRSGFGINALTVSSGFFCCRSNRGGLCISASSVSALKIAAKMRFNRTEIESRLNGFGTGDEQIGKKLISNNI